VNVDVHVDADEPDLLTLDSILLVLIIILSNSLLLSTYVKDCNVSIRYGVVCGARTVIVDLFPCPDLLLPQFLPSDRPSSFFDPEES
jgi:hypothetical protein